MLRSDYCSLHDQDDVQLSDLGECPYDQVCNFAMSHLAYPGVKFHVTSCPANCSSNIVS